MVSRFAGVFALIVFVTSLVGCATSRGFNRGALREDMSTQTVVSDEEIKKTLELRPQLPKPFKVGVFFKDPETAGRYGSKKWHWSDADKQKVIQSVEQLKSKGQISQAFVISPATVTGFDLKSLRLAAAQHGADALLVVGGVSDTDSYTNNWGWTYVALVTALFVPATETDVLFMSRAALWDVRNQFLYMTAEAESMKKQARPAAFTDERGQIERAKAESLEKLKAEIALMSSGLEEKAR